MSKFRRKLVIIEAYQVTRKMIEDHLFDDIPLPKGIGIGAASYHKKNRELKEYIARVDSKGWESYILNEGDWIIKGVKGEFYPCKPDIFEQTYEPIKDSP